MTRLRARSITLIRMRLATCPPAKLGFSPTTRSCSMGVLGGGRWALSTLRPSPESSTRSAVARIRLPESRRPVGKTGNQPDGIAVWRRAQSCSLAARASVT
jgi:hypothetical protein